MKKIYWILPLIAAVAFFFFYSSVKTGIAEKEVEKKRLAAEEHAARIAKDVEDRKKAFQIALDDANRRIKEIEERRKEEERKAAETQAAKDTRDLAYRERERQAKRFAELSDSRIVANEQLAKARETIELQRIQTAYIETTSKEVFQNKASYEMVLNKMEAAERAQAAAEAAARAAAAAAARKS